MQPVVQDYSVEKRAQDQQSILPSALSCMFKIAMYFSTHYVWLLKRIFRLGVHLLHIINACVQVIFRPLKNP